MARLVLLLPFILAKEQSFHHTLIEGAPTFKYPDVARDDDFTEPIHGRQYCDPYRELEEDTIARDNFIDAQNAMVNDHVNFELVQPFKHTMEKFYKPERFSCPVKFRNSYYYLGSTGLDQSHLVLYQQDSFEEDPKVFFDPNQLSEDGSVSLRSYCFSPDGQYFAYALSESGSEWVSLHVRYVGDNYDSEPPIKASSPYMVFTPDSNGFFYQSSPVTNEGTSATRGFPRLYYHYLGTSETEDLVKYVDEENPVMLLGVSLSNDGLYLLLSIYRESRDNKLYIAPIAAVLSESSTEWYKLIDTFDAKWEYIKNDGPVFYFLTTSGAPLKRIVKCNLRNFAWENVILQSNAVIEDFVLVCGNKLVLKYIDQVKHKIQIFNLQDGTLDQWSTDRLRESIGRSMIQLWRANRFNSELLYITSSYISPNTLHRYDFGAQEHSIVKTTQIQDYNPNDYQYQQEWYQSTNNARVPMYIISKANAEQNRENPTLLYAYGGFGKPIMPYFSLNWITFIQEMNGIVCVANIRGGGEFGRDWHEAGCGANKQNSIDDVINAAKFLIGQEWTTPSKLTLYGMSNGGMIAAACANQAPHLFGCVVAEAGVMDLTRFHLFTVGSAWKEEYGDPENARDFYNILKISPYHNVQDQAYPAMLLCTSDNDERVVPFHSYKLIAALQSVVGDDYDRPIMLRVDSGGGHGTGRTTQQQIKWTAERFAFIAKALRLFQWNESEEYEEGVDEEEEEDEVEEEGVDEEEEEDEGED